MLTKTQVKVILILLDNRGHAGWEIAEYLGKEDSNLNGKLRNLAEREIIYKGESRISKKPHKKKGNYNELPYYLKKDLEALKKIVGDLIDSERNENWFIFSLIRNSKYLESIRAQFGYEADTAIQGELKRDQIFSDEFYKKLANQDVCFEPAPVDENVSLCPAIKEKGELEEWYYSFYCIKQMMIFGISHDYY